MIYRQKRKVLMNNLFKEIPDIMKEEFVETVLSSKCKSIRIERIISRGHTSPAGFFYDQDENEWIIVLKGKAIVSFTVSGKIYELAEGDYINIPAHTRHRVEWTEEKGETVWLAVFY